MFNPDIEIQLIAVLTAAACALCGSFLFLRKMNMMADSITHTILLGIVLAFFVVRDLNSPLLLIFATLMGLFTVWLTELVHNTKLVSEDSSIGMVFPLLFSIAIILISKFASNVHIDTDTVLLGELAFAPFERFVVAGVDIGAKGIYVGLVLFIFNLAFVSVLFKELKLSSFDPGFAAAVGFMPTLIFYLLMSLVSLTTVGAFESMGSILVIAFMAAPPATAYLLTKKLHVMLILSVFFAILSAFIGYRVAIVFDISIAGAMASVLGILFLLVLLFSKQQGIVGVLLHRRMQKRDFFMDTFLIHVYHHQNDDDGDIETGAESIGRHLNWPQDRLKRTIKDLRHYKYIQECSHCYRLSPLGEQRTLALIAKLYPER
ncbi:MAG: metal ABC transporter permease [Eubacteriales bacterium]|nr:metal ABC transporter permease [Eubacteriales bacterium]